MLLNHLTIPEKSREKNVNLCVMRSMKRVIKYRKHDLCQAHINKNFRFSALLTAINSITRKNALHTTESSSLIKYLIRSAFEFCSALFTRPRSNGTSFFSSFNYHICLNRYALL